MKNFRKKAAPAIVLLAGASMSLAGVTFAWFNQNTNANVSKINVGVVDASGGVAVSDEANGTYKTSLDFNYVADDSTDNGVESKKFNKLDPISTNGDLNDNKNMFKFYKGVLSENDTSKIKSSGKVTEGDNAGYQAFDLFFENVSGSDRYVYFEYDSLVATYNDADNYAGLMTNFFNSTDESRYSLRIGFINLGNSNAKNGEKTAVGDPIIIEPDWKNHTDVAEAVIGETQDKTYALIGEFGSETSIRPNGPIADKMAQQVAYRIDECSYKDDLGRPLFTIKQGYTQIRVVMWIEGQDIDNDNSVSGKPISYNLKFNTKTVAKAVTDAQTKAKSNLNAFKGDGAGEAAMATEGVSKIEAASSVVGVKKELKTAEDKITQLRKERADALTKLSGYIGDWAPAEGDSYKAAYETALAGGITAINSAETVYYIGTALTAEEAKIKTAALDGAKAKAIAQLKDYRPDVYTRGTETVETFNFVGYDYAELETSINNSADFADLTANLNDAKVGIDSAVQTWVDDLGA